MNRAFHLLLAGAVLAGAGGCQPAEGPSHSKRQPLRPEAREYRPEIHYTQLQTVLAAALDEKGRLHQSDLRRVAGPLDAQLGMLSVAGPGLTPELLPTVNHRLAYWLNARAAWAIKLAAEAGFPERLGPQDFERRTFILDGREMTLAGIDLQLAGDFDLDGPFDWRAAVLAPGLRPWRAKLPAEPYQPETVATAIDERFNAYIRDPQRVVFDAATRQMHVPPMLWAYRKPLIDRYRQRYQPGGQVRFITALLPVTSGRARRHLQLYVGYQAVKRTTTDKLLGVAAAD